ncbi:protein of unknown function [Azospirillum baldaniorum]|uniref:Uncharacterized protein n=2 Tax=Azospirillum TaxID=191 RepID=A0A9P1NMM6_9PROT|nr:protein of unknown function [Azospirillum baldaniorum]
MIPPGLAGCQRRRPKRAVLRGVCGAGMSPAKKCDPIHFGIDKPRTLRYKPRHTGRDDGLAGQEP